MTPGKQDLDDCKGVFYLNPKQGRLLTECGMLPWVLEGWLFLEWLYDTPYTGVC